MLICIFTVARKILNQHRNCDNFDIRDLLTEIKQERQSIVKLARNRTGIPNQHSIKARINEVRKPLKYKQASVHRTE